METITKEEFKELAKHTSGICISVYIPTHKFGDDVLNGLDMICFKNSINDIALNLTKMGVKQGSVDKLLRPAEKLINDGPFWRHQHEGLAVFISESVFKFYKTNFPLNVFENINNKFYLTPLIPMLSENLNFYILALGKSNVRLFQATPFSILESELDQHVPKGMRESTLKFDIPTPSRQYHSIPGKPRGFYHGHEAFKDVEKINISIYLNEVSVSIIPLLKNKQAPLILAGVEYLLSIFKDVSKYPNIVSKEITGSFDYTSIPEMHEKALEIIEPILQNKHQEIKNKYDELINKNQASSDIKEILPASFQGKVQDLLIAKNKNEWGFINNKTNEIVVHEKYEKGDECLLNLVGTQTILQGGEVYLLNKEEMPGISNISGIFRY